MGSTKEAGVVPSEQTDVSPGSSNNDFIRKYEEERVKRIRQDGVAQYIDPTQSEYFKRLVEDPWVEAGTPIGMPFPDGGHCKVAIIGAGHGGILNAVRLIGAGVLVSEILIIDPAGGFGGTWYYNRYPGLMCDVESYIYMPLLEEMGYMPTRKYASGEEIRQHAENIAQKYRLHGQAMFQSAVQKVVWDASSNEWKLRICQKPKGGTETLVDIGADFVIFSTGIFNNAKLPDIKGNDEFKGEMFHTARWAYDITGGSPSDPRLTRLKDKRVGFIGTGATAVQAVPHLAKWAKQLYVFQRTPSSVDVRDNRDTDPAEWTAKVATKPGWQRERTMNFNSWISDVDPKPEVNMIDDAWTNMRSYNVLVGSPKTVTLETLRKHISDLQQMDFARQERIRQRAAQIVKDPTTAQGLQAYYGSWCKRPCFHDEYLQAFNSPNVTLVDTEGKGIEGITSKGILSNGDEYEVDVLIWATGYPSPAVGSLAWKAGTEIIGQNGERLEDVFEDGRLDTLHGVISRGFPNMFWSSHMQGGVAANYTFVLDFAASQIAYIISEASKKAGSSKLLVQPTQEAQEQWAQRIMQHALIFAAMSGCTPSYLNKESEVDRMTQEEQMKAARYSIWGRGMNDYVEVVEKWQADNQLQGLEVVAIPTEAAAAA